MTCSHFGECGSCSLYNLSYEEQIRYKKERFSSLFSHFFSGKIEVFSSLKEAYRARAEYKIYKDEENPFYAMRHLDKKRFVKILECSMVSYAIKKRMWRLLEIVRENEVLKDRLFGVEFLSTSKDDTLVTMLYHRKLDDTWIDNAKKLESAIDAKIIGRSRKQKVVLSLEYVVETLKIHENIYEYRHYEQSFTQPNTQVNRRMIEWAYDRAKEFGVGDFCELYAGSGNFTIPLSKLFKRVIATEVSKRSIEAAKQNSVLNRINNITFVRMSSEEFTEALEKRRAFNRLRGVNLDLYDLKTVLVDPPRAGLDVATKTLISKFNTIIYISCNPISLLEDLKSITKSHKIECMALFDQFPYTPHVESGVVLTRK